MAIIEIGMMSSFDRQVHVVGEFIQENEFLFLKRFFFSFYFLRVHGSGFSHNSFQLPFLPMLVPCFSDQVPGSVVDAVRTVKKPFLEIAFHHRGAVRVP